MYMIVCFYILDKNGNIKHKWQKACMLMTNSLFVICMQVFLPFVFILGTAMAPLFHYQLTYIHQKHKPDHD